jgi:hypothetical protein
MPKTYSNRTNARRAGVAAGNPTDRVAITVHKSAEGVRFGWKLDAVPHSPTKRFVAVPSTAKAAMKTPAPRLAQNGVKRPAPGGICAAVWDWLDTNPQATVRTLRDLAPARGWNINNVTSEFYSWRKFNGQHREVWRDRSQAHSSRSGQAPHLRVVGPAKKGHS